MDGGGLRAAVFAARWLLAALFLAAFAAAIVFFPPRAPGSRGGDPVGVGIVSQSVLGTQKTVVYVTVVVVLSTAAGLAIGAFAGGG